MAKRKNKLVIWKSKVDVWQWHLKSAYNGKIMCAGEPNGYSSRDKTSKGYKAVAESFIAGVQVVVE